MGLGFHSRLAARLVGSSLFPSDGGNKALCLSPGETSSLGLLSSLSENLSFQLSG